MVFFFKDFSVVVFKDDENVKFFEVFVGFFVRDLGVDDDVLFREYFGFGIGGGDFESFGSWNKEG